MDYLMKNKENKTGMGYFEGALPAAQAPVADAPVAATSSAQMPVMTKDQAVMNSALQGGKSGLGGALVAGGAQSMLGAGAMTAGGGAAVGAGLALEYLRQKEEARIKQEEAERDAFLKTQTNKMSALTSLLSATRGMGVS